MGTYVLLKVLVHSRVFLLFFEQSKQRYFGQKSLDRIVQLSNTLALITVNTVGNVSGVLAVEPNKSRVALMALLMKAPNDHSERLHSFAITIGCMVEGISSGAQTAALESRNKQRNVPRNSIGSLSRLNNLHSNAGIR